MNMNEVIAVSLGLIGLVVAVLIRHENNKKLRDTDEKLKKVTGTLEQSAEKQQETTEKLQNVMDVQGKATEEQRESTKELIDRATTIISMTIEQQVLEVKQSIRRSIRQVLLIWISVTVISALAAAAWAVLQALSQ